MRALGIDIGSSSIKGAVLDVAAETVSVPVSRAFPAPVAGRPNGWVEIDPIQVCQVFDEVLATLAAEAPEADRLLVCSQIGGLILIDSQTRPLTRYISWRDQRTTQMDDMGQSPFERLRSRWEDKDQFAALGHELQPGATACLLAWLHEHQDLPRNAVPCCLGDYVLARLVGHPVPMHCTQAVGLLDLTRDDWHRAALVTAGLQDVTLPELAFTETCVGSTHVAGRKLSVFGCYGDHQCALRGAGLESHELSINISTGSQVSRRVPRFQPGSYQSRKYFFGEYLDTITHIPAGRSLHVLVELLTELARAEGVTLRHSWETIQQQVAEVVDTDLQVDLAFFPSPVGDRGHIESISTGNLTVGTLFYAAYRSMADNYAQLAKRFDGCPWTAVVLSGGLSQSAPRLREFLEQQFSAPIRVSTGEQTLLGLLDIARTNSKGESEDA